MNRLITCTLLLFSSQCFSMGGVVTDPTSYTYYVQQIKQAKEQLDAAQKQLDTAMKTKDSILNIEKNVTGNLRRAQRAIINISNLKDDISKNPEKIFEYTSDALDDITKLDEYREDVTDNLNETFGLEGDDAIGGWGDVEQERTKFASRQRAAKKAIVSAEIAKGKISTQLEDLEDLVSAANTSDSIKDAQDVNNAMLAKMIENQAELIRLLADISQNISLAYYNGQENLDQLKPSVIGGKDLLNDSDFDVPKKSKGMKEINAPSECNFFAGDC